MSVSLFINGSHDPARTNFISWSPSACEVSYENVTAPGPIRVQLRNQRGDVGGQVVFYNGRNSPAQDVIELDLPADGSPIHLLVGGKFERASTENGDAAIDVIDVSNNNVLASVRLMVRVRKDANTLTENERKRFLDALASLNDQGSGRFRDFRNMHVAAASAEAHGRTGFLPWHRAYILDFERELQSFDPSVALPYWRFDKVADKVFIPEFMGVPNQAGSVIFSAENPLNYWRTDLGDGILREPRFDTANSWADDPQDAERILSEDDTLELGSGSYRPFVDPNQLGMEGNPHGYAHTCFMGYIGSIGTAAKDPLFFMLHANVDRLWARWQSKYLRYDAAREEVYSDDTRDGHRGVDTMWPWNQVRTSPRPNFVPPGGGFARSSIVRFPPDAPKVRDMMDYQGLLKPSQRLDFDYDDVNFIWLAQGGPA